MFSVWSVAMVTADPTYPLVPFWCHYCQLYLPSPRGFPSYALFINNEKIVELVERPDTAEVSFIKGAWQWAIDRGEVPLGTLVIEPSANQGLSIKAPSCCSLWGGRWSLAEGYGLVSSQTCRPLKPAQETLIWGGMHLRPKITCLTIPWIASLIIQ